LQGTDQDERASALSLLCRRLGFLLPGTDKTFFTILLVAQAKQ
jgi:hypothetical protein